MSEGAATTEGGNLVEAAQAPQPSAAALLALEQRVHRLEDAVAVMQDTRQLEDRVVERLSQRNAQAMVRDSAGLILDAGRRLLPAAVEVLQSSNQAGPGSAPQALPAPNARPLRRSWLVWDTLQETRAMLHMYMDPRYQMSWWGRLLPLLLFLAILTSWLWVPGATILDKLSDTGATILIKLVDLVLAYFLFKVLSWEAARYRETAPDLPHHLRP